MTELATRTFVANGRTVEIKYRKGLKGAINPRRPPPSRVITAHDPPDLWRTNDAALTDVAINLINSEPGQTVRVPTNYDLAAVSRRIPLARFKRFTENGETYMIRLDDAEPKERVIL